MPPTPATLPDPAEPDTLADTLGGLSAAAAAAALAIPPGLGQDVARIVQAALGVASTLAREGRTRAEIVAAIHRVTDIAPAIAAQDARIAARVAGKPTRAELTGAASREDEPTVDVALPARGGR